MKGIFGLIFLAALSLLLKQTNASRISVKRILSEELKVKWNASVSDDHPGYIYFPGIGYYSYEDGRAETFEDAEAACESTGGHLAIINSDIEASALVAMYAPNVGEGSWARLGFDDHRAKGDFWTIFGVPLAATGYEKWGDGEPGLNNDRNCGCMSRHGFLGTQICTDPRLFLCEIEL